MTTPLRSSPVLIMGVWCSGGAWRGVARRGHSAREGSMGVRRCYQRPPGVPILLVAPARTRGLHGSVAEQDLDLGLSAGFGARVLRTRDGDADDVLRRWDSVH